MNFGVVLPGGSARRQLAQAEAAEAAGWDGVFVWEAAYGVDAWSLLAAMAVRTERVRLGTMLTPLPWRRPWKVASQAVTLDELSAGRAVVAVGLGAADPALGTTSDPTDRRERAALLDDGLAVIDALWYGDGHYHGRRYSVDMRSRTGVHRPRPVNARLPVWIVGAWGHERSMRRVLRGDGLIPTVKGDDGWRVPTVDELAAMPGWLATHGATGRRYDLVMEGETPADDAGAARDHVRPWQEAGATWWLETRWSEPDAVDARIAARPPRP